MSLAVVVLPFVPVTATTGGRLSARVLPSSSALSIRPRWLKAQSKRSSSPTTVSPLSCAAFRSSSKGLWHSECGLRPGERASIWRSVRSDAEKGMGTCHWTDRPLGVGCWGRLSTTRTSAPLRCSQSAMAQPDSPAPTTRTRSPCHPFSGQGH